MITERDPVGANNDGGMDNSLDIFVSAHLCYQFLHIVLKSVWFIKSRIYVAQEYSKHNNEYIWTYS